MLADEVALASLESWRPVERLTVEPRPERLYLLRGADLEQSQRIASELLANPVIQTIDVMRWDDWLATDPDLTVPRVPGEGVPEVARVALDGDDAELERISREGLLASTLQEMQAIRDHFSDQATTEHRQAAGLDARPTDVELECLAQTWSEHCMHKIFNASVTYHEGDGAPQPIRKSGRRTKRAPRKRRRPVLAAIKCSE